MKNKILFIVRLSISLGLLLWLFHKADVRKVLFILKNFSFSHWFLALFLMIVGQSICAWRWKVIASAVEIRAPFRLFWAYYFVGCYFNLFLPGSITGDIVKGYLIAQNDFSKLKVGYSIVGERIFGLAALVCLAMIGVLVASHLFPQTIRHIILLSGALFVTTFTLFPLWGKRLKHISSKKIPLDFLNFWYPPVFLKAIAASLIFQTILSFMNYVLAKGLGLNINFCFFLVAIPIISVVTMLPITIQGIGIREGSFVYLLSSIGISSAKALTLSLLSFSITIGIGVIGGIIYICGLHHKKERLGGRRL